MENKIKELKAQFENELSAIKDLSELEDIRVSYLGKKRLGYRPFKGYARAVKRG